MKKRFFALSFWMLGPFVVLASQADLPTVSPCQSGLITPEICQVDVAYKTADVTWQKVQGATGYLLGFSFSNAGFVPLAKVPATTQGVRMQARLVHGQAGAERYFFAVRAIREDRQGICESGWSAPRAVQAVASLAAVTNLRVTKSAENAHLAWDPVAGADFYLVLRTKQIDLPAGWITMAAIPAFLPEAWDDPVIFDGESYDYDVTAEAVPALWQVLTGTPWPY